MIQKFIASLIILLALGSCTLMKGSGKTVDSLVMEGDFPISLNGTQIDQAHKKLPRQARWYRAYWGAIPVAEMVVLLFPTQEGYGMRVAIRTVGIANLVSRWKSDTGATLTQKASHEFSPERYLTAFELRKRKRRIEILWDESGIIKKETNTPPENRNKRPEVPGKDKTGVYDPITSVFAIRSHVIDSIQKKSPQFVIPLYDGRRRGDLLFTVRGATKDGNIHVSFTEKPVSGYTENELQDLSEEQSVFHILLDPKDLLPIAVKGQSVLGSGYIRLKKICASFDECLDHIEGEV